MLVKIPLASNGGNKSKGFNYSTDGSSSIIPK